MWSKCGCELTSQRIGLPGASFAISSMTARLRCLVAGRLEHGDEVAELDHVAVGRAAAEQVHAVGHLRRRSPAWRERALARPRPAPAPASPQSFGLHVRRTRRRSRCGRCSAGRTASCRPSRGASASDRPLDAADRDLSSVDSCSMLKSPSAGSLTVVLMRCDLVLRVDGGVDAVLAEHRDRDDVHLLGHARRCRRGPSRSAPSARTRPGSRRAAAPP